MMTSHFSASPDIAVGSVSRLASRVRRFDSRVQYLSRVDSYW